MLTLIQSPRAAKLSPSPNYDTPAGKRSQLIVVHDVESPLAQRYCDTLAGPAWFGSTKAETSAHYIVGPSYAIQMVREQDRAWHCGPAGNILSIGIEQTGYARYSRSEWLTDDGRDQIRVLADLMADISQRHGGSATPQRASNAQIQAYARGGSLPGGVMWCTHHQITESLGGTTHTDPDPNYPYDVLQQDIDGHGKPAKPAPGGTVVYIVKAGDTLTKIARAHGTTVAAIVHANDIKDPDEISVGQKLRLASKTPSKPKPKPGVHVKGVSVEDVQHALNAHGADLLPDNTWGPKTQAAVNEAKKARHLPQDGIVGTRLWKAIRPKVKTYTPPPGPWPLKPGNYFGLVSGPAQSHGGYYQSERKYIRWIKVRLRELGYKVPAGGIFRGGMKRAVAAWQHDRHASTTSRPGEVWAGDWANLINDR